ncbi:unnamed protein product, partial [marine sediment metagenome]
TRCRTQRSERTCDGPTVSRKGVQFTRQAIETCEDMYAIVYQGTQSTMPGRHDATMVDGAIT